MPSIETFIEQHIDAALDLWRASEHMGLSSADEPVRLAAFLVRNPACSFVATEEDRVVGACLCGHDGRRGYIYHLAVAPGHRRGRLGSKLVERSLVALREAGIAKCHAFVFDSNPHGDLFWMPAGWERRNELLVFSKVTAAGG